MIYLIAYSPINIILALKLGTILFPFPFSTAGYCQQAFEKTLCAQLLIHPPLHSLLLIPSCLFHLLLMRRFVLIVIYSHSHAECCQQPWLLQAACCWIKFKIYSRPEHKNANTSETPTDHLHWSVRDSSPDHAWIFDKNKMSEGETHKVWSRISRVYARHSVLSQVPGFHVPQRDKQWCRASFLTNIKHSAVSHFSRGLRLTLENWEC